MQVYVEYVILDNLIIDFILLKLSTNSARVKSGFFRILTASIIGVVFAVIMPLLNLKTIYNFIVKILLGAVMARTSMSYFTYKKFAINYLFFMLYTFLMGGVIIAIFFFAGINYEVYFSLNYNSFMPIGISILIVFIAYLLILKLIKAVFINKDICSFKRKCIIVVKDKRFTVKGFIDSGNHLYENGSGLPVIIASKNLSKQLNQENLKFGGTVNYSTVSGSGNINLYVIDKLLVYNGENLKTIKNVVIGLSSQDFFASEYDLLLHPALF